jgi:hypothetical protein
MDTRDETDRGKGMVGLQTTRLVMTMPIETAREITAACVRTAFSTMSGEYVPLPKRSLIEMLQANDLVAGDRETSADGSTQLLARCAPRIIAACYAYEEYGRSGGDLLEAVGLTGRKDALQRCIAEVMQERDTALLKLTQMADQLATAEACRELNRSSFDATLTKTLSEVDRIAMVPAFDLLAHLRRQREFSARAFGPPGEPGAQTWRGVLDHLRKEMAEVTARPDDAEEWADLILLACDGAMRAGHAPEAIVGFVAGKLATNEARTWPDWREQDPDMAIEHDAATAAVAAPQPQLVEIRGVTMGACTVDCPHYDTRVSFGMRSQCRAPGGPSRAAVVGEVCPPWAAHVLAAAALQRRLGQEDVLDAVCSQGFPHPGGEDLEEWADRIFAGVVESDMCQAGRASEAVESALDDEEAAHVDTLRMLAAERERANDAEVNLHHAMAELAADSRKPAGIE